VHYLAVLLSKPHVLRKSHLVTTLSPTTVLLNIAGYEVHALYFRHDVMARKVGCAEALLLHSLTVLPSKPHVLIRIHLYTLLSVVSVVATITRLEHRATHVRRYVMACQFVYAEVLLVHYLAVLLSKPHVLRKSHLVTTLSPTAVLLNIAGL
jgi:hypothetical protein